jgi:hypothetical protein
LYLSSTWTITSLPLHFLHIQYYMVKLINCLSYVNSMYKTLERYRTCNYNSHEANPPLENEVSISSS